MKTIYTILFFADTFLLICLSWLFLHRLDNNASPGNLALIFAGIIICIFLSVLLLRRYIKQPPGRRRP